LMEVQASRYRMVQGCQNTLGISGAIGACPRHPLTLNLRRCVVPNCESVACAGLSTMSPLTRGSSVTSFEEEKARSKPQIGSPNGFFSLALAFTTQKAIARRGARPPFLFDHPRKSLKSLLALSIPSCSQGVHSGWAGLETLSNPSRLSQSRPSMVATRWRDLSTTGRNGTSQ